MKTIGSNSFRDLRVELERDYGPQSPNLWEGVQLIWKRERERGNDAEGAVRDAMPALVRAAMPETPARSRFQTASGQPCVGGGDKAERDHARLLKERIERFGNTDPEVCEFRQKAWGSPRPLAARDARLLLESPLLRYFFAEHLRKWGIPLVGHTARIVEQKQTEGRESTRIEARWSEGTRTKRHTLTFHGLPDPEQLYLEYPNEQGRIVSVQVQLFSFLGELRRVATALVMGAPFEVWWLAGELPAAVWFLVSGEAPDLAPITTSWSIPGSVDVITIHALARVASPKSVRSAFASAQRQVLGHHKRRRHSRRNLRLVNFVEERVEGSAGELPLDLAQKLREEWNQRNPRDKFKWSARELRNAYHRTASDAFFPETRFAPMDALARGRLTWELAALAVVDHVIAERTTGEPPSTPELAKRLLRLARGDGNPSPSQDPARTNPLPKAPIDAAQEGKASKRGTKPKSRRKGKT